MHVAIILCDKSQDVDCFEGEEDERLMGKKYWE